MVRKSKSTARCTEEFHEDLELVVQLARHLMNGPADSLDRQTLEIIRECQRWDYCSLWEWQPATGSYRFKQDCGNIAEDFRSATRRANFRRGEGLVGRASEAKELLQSDSLAQACSQRNGACTAAGVASVVAVPILLRGAVQYVLELVSTSNPVLMEERKLTLQAFSELLGSSLAVERITEPDFDDRQRVDSSKLDHYRDCEYQIASINRVQAVVEFDINGKFLRANEGFLRTMEYSVAEIQGQHHRIFVSQDYAASTEYSRFWEDLRAGRAQTGEFQRFSKSGRVVWLTAFYIPVLDDRGAVTKIMKSAMDTTERKLAELAAAEQKRKESLFLVERMGAILGSVEGSDRNIQTVASATEEMAASISEIAGNANQAAKVVARAVDVTNQTNQTISELGESSAEIGNVVKLITSIAQQTNLLALNATIEAARAGEAGRGFAVVANEVKELAKETARATEVISSKIAAIQTDTGGAVRAIGEIHSIISEVSEIAASIAGAVEEQSATTSEMSRSVTEVAEASREIMGAVAEVTELAERGKIDDRQ